MTKCEADGKIASFQPSDITPAQIRAARALLDWTREELAARSLVSVTTTADFETGKRNLRARTIANLRSALESGGVVFIAGGVRSDEVPVVSEKNAIEEPLAPIADAASGSEMGGGRPSPPRLTSDVPSQTPRLSIPGGAEAALPSTTTGVRRYSLEAAFGGYGQASPAVIASPPLVSAAAPMMAAAEQPPAPFDWSELVVGFRLGNLQWNIGRLGPRPDQIGCRAPAEILKEYGYDHVAG
jgi:transcriptional regulator with XRE-family HTH domain